MTQTGVQVCKIMIRKQTVRLWFYVVILVSLSPFLWLIHFEQDARGRRESYSATSIDVRNSDNYGNTTKTPSPKQKTSTEKSSGLTTLMLTTATTTGKTVTTAVKGLTTTTSRNLSSSPIYTDPCHERFVTNSVNIPATHDPTKKRIIFTDGVGRLGNKMFQYAALLGLAKLHGFTPLVYRQNLVVSVFEISHVTDTNYKNMPVYFEKAAAIYDPCLETMRHDWDWRLGGYYQSWRYFSNVQDEVKKEFTFKEETRAQVSKILKEIEAKFQGRPKVGVHVRRGDMHVDISLQKGYTVANKEYFFRAMEYFRKAVKNPVFVIISDDTIWCRQQFGNEKDVTFVHGSLESDLATLASCDHSIISTGTYGWWGAWLAGGRTVYYKNFPNKRSWLATQYKADDYFPPSWIGME